MQNNVAPYLAKIRTYFHDLSDKIKLGVLAACLLLVFLLWRIFFWGMIDLDRNGLRSKVNSLKKSIAVLEQSFEEVQAKIKSGELVKKTKMVDALSAEESKKEDLLKVLTQPQGMHLITMKSKEDKNQKSMKEMRLSFKGSYFSLLGYVNKLIMYKVPVQLQQIDYRVTNYPEADILITLKVW